MVYNTGSGDSLQKLLDEAQISGKRCGYYCWKLLLEIVDIIVGN